MYNIIALIGEAGSGKDYTMKRVRAANPALHEIVSCTTRPMREGEIDSVNYFFYSKEDFEKKYFNNEMLETSMFNNWLYGTSYDSLKEDEINIGVFNPEGVRSLLTRSDCNVIVFWIQTNDKIRLLRQLNREENPNVREVVRRFKADYNDFDNIDFNYINLINNTEDDLERNIKEILVSSEHFFTRGQN